MGRKFILAVILAAAFSNCALSQGAPVSMTPAETVKIGTTSITPSPTLNINAPGTVVAKSETLTTPTVAQAPTVIQVGSLAGEVLQWVVAAFGTVISGFIAAWLVKVAKKLGVDVTDQQRSRLQEIIDNGLSLAAHKAGTDLNGKIPVDVRSKIIADAVKYAQEHGADTIKSLGGDPKAPGVTEALTARAAASIDEKGSSGQA